jgi:hypothetical protein
VCTSPGVVEVVDFESPLVRGTVVVVALHLRQLVVDVVPTTVVDVVPDLDDDTTRVVVVLGLVVVVASALVVVAPAVVP